MSVISEKKWNGGALGDKLVEMAAFDQRAKKILRRVAVALTGAVALMGAASYNDSVTENFCAKAYPPLPKNAGVTASIAQTNARVSCEGNNFWRFNKHTL
jgi:hypothetical protein